jgi:hypothetical protein
MFSFKVNEQPKTDSSEGGVGRLVPESQWVCLRRFQCGPDEFGEGEVLTVRNAESSGAGVEVEFSGKGGEIKRWHLAKGQNDYSHLIVSGKI